MVFFSKFVLLCIVVISIAYTQYIVLCKYLKTMYLQVSRYNSKVWYLLSPVGMLLYTPSISNYRSFDFFDTYFAQIVWIRRVFKLKVKRVKGSIIWNGESMCRRGFQKETNLFSKVKRAIYTNGTKMAYCTNIINYINTNANLVAWKNCILNVKLMIPLRSLII